MSSTNEKYKALHPLTTLDSFLKQNTCITKHMYTFTVISAICLLTGHSDNQHLPCTFSSSVNMYIKPFYTALRQKSPTQSKSELRSVKTVVLQTGRKHLFQVINTIHS